MAVSFPTSPSTGDTFDVGRVRYEWSGSAWKQIASQPVSTGAEIPFTKADGSTSDPIKLASSVIGDALVNDTTPQLGGNLDVNGNSIVSDSGNENIPITPHGTGSVVVSKIDVAAGEIDGTAIGANSASTGAFTTLSTTGALTVGVDDTGHDVKFFGATSNRYMLWDESGDLLNLRSDLSVFRGSNGTDRRFFVDESSGGVSFNTDSGSIAPDGHVHIHSGSAGTVSASVHYDDLVVEGSGNTGISILAPEDYTSGIALGSNNDNDIGYIYAQQSGTAGSRFMAFAVNAAERMRIDSSGMVDIGGSGTPYPSTRLSVKESTAGNGGIASYKNNDSASNTCYGAYTDRAASDAVNLFASQTDSDGDGGGADTQHVLAGDGDGHCDGSWSGGGADYAEYFESVDGSALAVGITVVMSEDKIRAYNASSDSVGDIIGVVRPSGDSRNCAIIGNAGQLGWSHKYLTDDYGSYIHEDYTVWEWDDVLYADGDDLPDGKAVGDVKLEGGTMADYKRPDGWTPPDGATTTTQQKRKENPDFDKSRTYAPRAERDEWNLIGLLGQVQIKANEATNPRWIKMTQVSDAVDLWLVR